MSTSCHISYVSFIYMFFYIVTTPFDRKSFSFSKISTRALVHTSGLDYYFLCAQMQHIFMEQQETPQGQGRGHDRCQGRRRYQT